MEGEEGVGESMRADYVRLYNNQKLTLRATGDHCYSFRKQVARSEFAY